MAFGICHSFLFWFSFFVSDNFSFFFDLDSCFDFFDEFSVRLFDFFFDFSFESFQMSTRKVQGTGFSPVFDPREPTSYFLHGEIFEDLPLLNYWWYFLRYFHSLCTVFEAFEVFLRDFWKILSQILASAEIPVSGHQWWFQCSYHLIVPKLFLQLLKPFTMDATVLRWSGPDRLVRRPSGQPCLGLFISWQLTVS